MRIGMITGEYPPMQGGVADYSRELARAMAALGHQIDVLTDHRGVGCDDPGVQVQAAVHSWNRAGWRLVRRWAQAYALDMVNLQYQAAAYNMAGLVHFIPRLLGDVPCVTTFHDLRVPYLFPKAGDLRYKAVLTLTLGSRAVIVTNREDERQLKSDLEGQKNAPRLAKIPIGSNIPAAAPNGFDRPAWRTQLGVTPGETLVSFFGFMNRSKGIEALLRAMSNIHCADLPFRLLMIGGRTGDSDPTNAAYAAEIEALVTELGLDDVVIWTGYVEQEEVSAHLYAADICALPYRDGVSFRRGSFMAALAHGCAILSTVPPLYIPELKHKGNIYLVPPDSVSALAVGLRTLATDVALRQQLGREAKLLAMLFDWDSIAAQTVALFEESLH